MRGSDELEKNKGGKWKDRKGVQRRKKKGSEKSWRSKERRKEVRER